MIEIVPETYIGVREAARRSGYSRTYIHNLANDGVIGSQMVTPSFRLVSWPDVVEYMREQGKEPDECAAQESEVVVND